MKKIILIAVVGGIIALILSLLIIQYVEEQTPKATPIMYSQPSEPEKKSFPEPVISFNRTAPPATKANPDEDAPPIQEGVPSK